MTDPTQTTETQPTLIVPPPATGNPALDNVISILQQASLAAALVAPFTGPAGPEIEAGAKLSLLLETIVQAAVTAHQQALGTPMDLSKLHPIEPLA